MIRPISSSARSPLGLDVVAEPPLELAQDRIAGVPAHADDEGKAEFLPVGGIEPAEAVEFLRAQPVEAEAALFGLGMAAVRSARATRLPSSGWPPMKASCRSGGACRTACHHGVVQGGHGRVGPARGGCLGHPGGVFEHLAERRDKGVGRQRVEGGQGQRSVLPWPHGNRIGAGETTIFCLRIKGFRRKLITSGI